jgi:hypothetical protein
LVPSISIPAWPLYAWHILEVNSWYNWSDCQIFMSFSTFMFNCQLSFTSLTWQHFWLFLNRTEEQKFTPLQFSKRKTCLSKKIANNQADLKPSMGKMKW